MEKLSPKDRIIFPLDLPSKDEALGFVRLLKGHVGVFKVGLELFVSSGPPVVEAIKKEAPEAKVFLDMKFHDIPETVGRAVASAASLGVDFITVHCDSGRGLLEAVARRAGKVKVLGVTLLTSLSGNDLGDMGIAPELRDPGALVLHRARIAKLAGLGGVVCSGLEVKKVKETFGKNFIAVTPGIRFSTQDIGTAKKDDQKRIASPYEAVRDGADYIVVGRPIRDASDPVEAASLIAKEIEKATSKAGW
ncbi:MAG: orotidine-5'-phosphate decarboxylase [Deltaproteobacteria bacterium]|nr:orotidine-5'-phosphate decarboxylase [Deltaproteobacteria bacterium]